VKDVYEALLPRWQFILYHYLAYRRHINEQGKLSVIRIVSPLMGVYISDLGI